MPRDNSYDTGFPIDPTSRQPIGQHANYFLNLLNKFVPVGSAAPMPVTIGAGSNLDANARLKVGNPLNLFQNKNIHTRNKTIWEEPIVGAIIVHGAVTGGPYQVGETVTDSVTGQQGTVTAVAGDNLSITYTVNHNDFAPGSTLTGGTSGATSVITSINTGSHVSHDRDLGSVLLKRGANTNDQAVRSSHRYLPYIPGKATTISETFLFNVATTSSVRLVRRTSTSGSPVDIPIEQADWDDPMLDGSGASGETLDWAQQQYFWFDFVWQGTSQIRSGFKIGGVFHQVHQENHANVNNVPFMSTPSLPVRYEITKTASGTRVRIGYFDGLNGLFLEINTTENQDILREVCTVAVSEGGENLSGFGFTKSTDVSPRTIAFASGEVPFFAIRPKASYGSDGGPNRKTGVFSNMSAFATGNNAHVELKHVHGPKDLVATWLSVSDDSAMEYSTDIASYAGSPEHSVEELFPSAGGASAKGGGETEVSGTEGDQHRFITQNFDSTNGEMFVLKGASFVGNTVLSGHISWLEHE